MTENKKLSQSIAAQRLLAAHHLQCHYHIAAKDMAFVLGLTPQIYQKRLKRAGLSSAPPALPVLDIEDLLIKINTELRALSQAQGLPEKAAVEALASLSKAVKSISELSKETRIERQPEREANQVEQSGVKPEEVREALSFISARIAALYEQARVRHSGRFAALEDEMCDFAVSGLSSGHSPDRVDALVWALHALMLQENQKPKIRQFR